MPTRPAIIFYYEENQMLLQTVKDVLEFAGWYVRPCSSDGYAFAYAGNSEHFDLMILDHDSRASGLGLVRRARANPPPRPDAHHPHLSGRHRGGSDGGRRGRLPAQAEQSGRTR